jgi:signal transduction histidine kinase
MARLLLILASCLLFASVAQAHVPVEVRYYVDASASLSLGDILRRADSIDWKPAAGNDLDFGSTRARVWFRFNVPAKSLRYGNAVDLFPEISTAYISRIHLFTVRRGVAVRDLETGLAVPVRERNVDVLRAGFPIFRIPAPRELDDEYFISIEGTLPLSLPLQVWEAPDLALHHWVGVLVQGLYLGCLLLALLSNAVLGISLRSRLYLSFASFVFFGTMFALAGTGLSVQLLWPDSPWWAEHEAVIYALLASGAYVYFVREFLGTPRLYPLADKVLIGTVAVRAARTAWLLVRFDPVVYTIGNLASSVGNMAAFGLGVAGTRRGLPGARLFLISSAAFDFSVVFFSLRFAGLSWIGQWAAWAPYYGAFVQIVLLTFALADRLRLANRELASHRAAIVQAEKIAALGRMAGELAHEINNPLAIIHGHASLIRRDPNLPQVAEFAATIENTANRISKVVKGMRSLSRDSRRDPLQPVAFDAILQDALALCRENARSRGVQLDASQAQNITLRCRSSEICQVLVNLISNALDAVEGRDGARVWVETLSRDERVEVSVLDNGPGVPPDARARLLEPFFTTKAPGKGLGLGLSISRTIVEGHGGELWYDERSRFTRFAFTVPVQNRYRISGRN